MAGRGRVMNRSRLRHVLMESGLCFDRIRLLEWLLKHDRMRVLAFRFLRLRFSPAILSNAVKTSSDLTEAGRLFSLGMSFINVGDTYKTTTSERTVLADEVLSRLAKTLDGPQLLEIGVSDGSSSLNLLRRKDIFSSIILTDRFSHFHVRKIPLGKMFFDGDRCLLGIKLLCFYLNLALEKSSNVSDCSRIETVNPVVEKEGGISVIDQFNLFEDVLEEPVHFIKCSNILNESYFTSEQIVSAVGNLAKSLVLGGRLVVSHNNDKYKHGEAVLVLRNDPSAFCVEENLNQHELAPLFESYSSDFQAAGE
ncbi:MAG: hypothetical protein JEY79_07390 [Pseudodesulfovibrio sp.]|nr:hypothetical protein [Pseudodesulfovibrio sp.]